MKKEHSEQLRSWEI